MANIELRNIGHRFPGAERDTLSGVDISIGDGEAHAILGSSGAGKSTLLNLIAGLLTPSTGQVMFDGQPVNKLRPRERNVAFVFQFPVLYEGLSIADNIAFPLVSQGHQNPLLRSRVVAEMLDLQELDRRPAELTLFEKQLVAVAKSIAREDVNVLLLDEPLTAVEPTLKWRMRRVLKDVHRNLGVTMIYVTHDQTEALTFADRVTVVHDGVVLQTATPAELIDTPAHEHIGHFIGSPGMNLVPGVTVDPRLSDCVIGFRPNWGRLVNSDHETMSGARSNSTIVTATQPTSTRRGQPFGTAIAELDGQLIKTVQELTFAPGDTRQLIIERHVIFRDGWRIADPS